MLKSLLIVAVLFARSGAWAQINAPAEKAVLESDQRWRKAVRTGDTATLDALLADDYIGVSITGQVSSKAAVMVRAKAMTPEQRTAYAKIDDYFEDVRVRRYGNVAVITGAGAARRLWRHDSYMCGAETTTSGE